MSRQHDAWRIPIGIRGSLAWHRRIAVRAALVALALACAPASAATLTWGTSGTGGDGTWDTSTAGWWNGSTNTTWSNAAPDSAVFAGTAGTVTLNTGITAGGLTFSTSGYLVTGNTLTLSGATPAITMGTNVTGTIASILAGSSGLSMSGAGSLLVVTATNTYTGNTTVSSGTLQVGDGGVTGSLASTTASVSSGASLAFRRSDSLTYSGLVSGAGNIVQLGSGTLTLTAQNSVSGTVQAAAGTLRLNNPISLRGPGVVSSGATMTLESNAAGGYFLASRIDVTTGTINSVIASSNRYHGIYTGTMNFSGGASLVSTPVFMNQAGNANPYTLTVTVDAGANGTISGAINNHPDVTNGGTLTKVGSGTLTLAANNGFTGNVNVNAGTLSISAIGSTTNNALGTNTAGKTLTVAAGATLETTSAYDSIDFTSGVVNNIAFVISGTWNNNPSNTQWNGFQRVDNLTLNSGVINDRGQSFNATSSYPGITVATGTITVNGTSTYNQLGINTGLGIGAIVINTPGATDRFVLSGGMRNTAVSTGAPVKTGTGTLVITGASSYTNGTTISSGTIVASNGSALGSGGVTLNNASTSGNRASLYLDATSGNVTMGNAITVANQGTGTATLGSASTANTNQAVFSGGITLNKAVVLDGGSVGDRLGFSGGIGGTGNVTVIGTNRVVFNSTANTYTGTTTVNAGAILQVGDGTPVSTSFIPDASVLVANGTVNLTKGSNSEIIGGLAGSGTVQGFPTITSVASTLEVSGGQSQVFSGVLGNGGASGSTLALTKSGAGLQILTGTSTYTGATTITGGTLQIGNNGAAGAIAATSAVSVSAGAALAFGRADAVTYSGTVGGAGNLVQLGSGTLTLTGANTYTGTTSLAAGSLSLGSANAIGTTGTISFTGGTLQYSASNQTDYSNRFSTAANQAFSIDTNGQGVSFGTVLSSSAATLTKLGSGTLTLTANNTYSGATTVSGGVLRLGSGGAAGSVAGNIVNNATLLVNRSDAYTLSSLVSGTGGLVQVGTGTTTLSNAANSYTGATTVSGGVLAVSTDLNLGAAPGSATPGGIVIDGATLAFTSGFALNSNRGIAVGPATGSGTGTIDVASGQTLAYGGVIASNGAGTDGLAKTGAGVLSLTGAATYNGDTSVNAGTLQIGAGGSLASPLVTVASGATLSGRGTVNAVSVSSGGIIAPGITNSGTLTTGGLTFGGLATVTMGVSGTVPGNLLNVIGNVTTLGGGNSVTFAFGGSLANIVTGTYSLLTYTGTLSDASAFGYSGTTGGRQSVAVSGTTVANAVSLVIGNAFPIWTGDNGTGWFTSGNWDLNTDLSPTNFQNNDTVEFNDLATSGTVVISGSNATPASTTFSGNTKNMTVEATGGFGISTGSVIKSGSALVTITNANTYGGGTTLSAGRLRVGDDGALGTGVVNVTAPAALSSDGATAHTLANSLHLDADVTLGDATDNGNLTISGTVTFDGASRTITTPSNVTLSGLVTNGGLTKAGAGVMTITGSNNYANGTTLSAGTLRAGNDAALGTGGVTLANGVTLSSNSTTARSLANAFTLNGDVTLGDATNTGPLTLGAGGISLGGGTRQITTPSNVTFAGAVTSGGLVKLGAGTLTLSASNSYGAGTTLSAGGIVIGNVTALGTGNVTYAAAGTIQSTAAGTVANAITVNAGISGTFDSAANSVTLSGAVTNSGTFTLTTTATQTLSGTVSGTGTVVKLGDGTLTLAAANSYAGGTRLSAGTLALGDVGGLGSGALTVAANAAIRTALTGTIANAVTIDPSVTGTFDAQSGAATWSGVIGGSGALAKAGAGTVVLTATNTYAGDTTISAGTLQIAGAGLLGGGSYAGAITNSGTLSITSSATQTLSGAIANAGTVAVNAAGNQTISGAVSGVGGLTKAGAGTLTLSNASNSYSGGSTVSGGTVAFASGALGSSGSVTVNGGALRWATGNTQDLSSRLALVNATTATLDTNGNDVTFASGFGGSTTAALVKAGAGTLTLTAANSATGLTTISGGTLQVGNGGTTGSLASTTASVSSGASLAFNRSDSVSYTGLVSGAGNIVQLGSGTLTLTAQNSVSGTVQAAAGTLRLNNPISLRGPGVVSSGATMTLESNAAGGYFLASRIDVTTGTINSVIASSNRYHGIYTGTMNFSGGASLVSTPVFMDQVGTSSKTLLVTVDGGATGTISGPVANHPDVGGGALTKAGVGTLVLTAANTYSNATTISGGTLQVGNGGTTGSLASTTGTVSSGASLAFNRSDAVTYSGTLSGAGNIVQLGSGTLTLTAQSALSGTVQAAAGTLWLANARSLTGPAVVSAGATMTLENNFGGAFYQPSRVDVTTGTINSVFTSPGNRYHGIYTDVMNFRGGASSVSTPVYMDKIGNASGTLTVTVDGGATGTISGAVANHPDLGGGALTKAGNGTLVLTGTNTYSNATTISSGTLILGGAGQLGGGSYGGSISNAGVFQITSSAAQTLSGAIANSGTIAVNSAANQTLSGVVSGAGLITKAGAGTLVLTNASNSFTGGATLTGGTLSFVSGGLGSSGPVSLGGGTLRWESGNTQDLSTRLALVNSSTTTLDIGSNNVTLASGFGGGATGALVKTGAGTLTMTGANDYTGGTTLTQGTLSFGNGGLGAFGNVTLAPSTVLQWAAGNTQDVSSRLVLPASGTLTLDSGANAVTLASTLGAGSAASLVKAGSGALVLSATSGYTGLTTVSGGTLGLSGDGSIASSSGLLLASSGATFDLAAASGGRAIGSLTGVAGSAIELGGNTLTAGSGSFAGVIAGTGGGLTKTGVGTLTLDGVNTYTGATTISGGTLALVGSGVLGGGIYAGPITNDAAFLVATSANQTLSGVVSGAGQITKTGAGTLALTGANDYTGGTTLSQGTLSFATGGLGSSGTVTLAASTVLEWAAGNTQDVSSRLVLPGSGGVTLDVGANDVTFANGLGAGSGVALTKAGAGTLTLTGSSGYTGLTTVSTGTLALSGSGAIAPTSAVALQAAESVFDISGASGNRTIGVLSGAAGSAVLLGGNTLAADGDGLTTPFLSIISGSGGFTKVGDGQLILSDVQAFTGPARVDTGLLALGGTNTLASASSIFVGSGATLETALNGLTVFAGQTLGGRGTVDGSVTFLDGSILSPGGSVGTLTNAGSTTWNSGFTYLFEVNNASGTAGGPSGWDLYNLAGTLTLAAGPEFANQIVIDLTSLSGTSPGFATGFDENANYAWLIADAGSEISTFDATWFRVNTGNFQNLPGEPGRFSVVRGDNLTAGFGSGTSDQLFVVYAAIPEPGTVVLAGLGLVGIGLAAARRRKARSRRTG